MRKRSNLTQYQLAECLDYANERQLQRIENGTTACSVDKLMEISQILDVSTDFLLFGAKSTDESDILEIFNGTSEIQRWYLVKVLKVIAENLRIVV
ncbi:MAG: helix-turn-helix domain-containing protein [Roseburia sp.]|nr:helix-turn-helix domain-containing protein [Roseburia sp.]